MTTDLPDYYFRVKENGASVFRLDTENRHRRIEMDHIANVNIRSGEIRPNGKKGLTDDDMTAIQKWTDDRAALLDKRDVDDIFRVIDQMNLTAQWVQSRAADEQIEQFSDALLLAMHDLRTVLVRKKMSNADTSEDE